MKNNSENYKQYGIGKNYFGIWFNSGIIDNESYKSFKISLFPLSIHIIIENNAFCLRIKLFERITISSLLEIS